MCLDATTLIYEPKISSPINESRPKWTQSFYFSGGGGAFLWFLSGHDIGVRCSQATISVCVCKHLPGNWFTHIEISSLICIQMVQSIDWCTAHFFSPSPNHTLRSECQLLDWLLLLSIAVGHNDHTTIVQSEYNLHEHWWTKVRWHDHGWCSSITTTAQCSLAASDNGSITISHKTVTTSGRSADFVTCPHCPRRHQQTPRVSAHELLLHSTSDLVLAGLSIR